MFTALFSVNQLLTPIKMAYQAAKQRAQLYGKIVVELLEMLRKTV